MLVKKKYIYDWKIRISDKESGVGIGERKKVQRRKNGRVGCIDEVVSQMVKNNRKMLLNGFRKGV